MPQILWTKYFLEAQGYPAKETMIHQENLSSITLEKNGKTSSSKRTKHIQIRYFFIKDKIDNKEVSVKYCPTEDMWADVLTKPLQGKKFRTMRATLMNCPTDYEELTNITGTCQLMNAVPIPTASSQGCVGTQTNLGCRKDTTYLRYKKKGRWQCPIANVKNYAHYHVKHDKNEKTKKANVSGHSHHHRQATTM